MPIGVGTAIGIGGAVLGAGAGIYSASKQAKAQKQAAQTASDTSLQVAQENNQLFRDIYGQNLQIASPFYNNGLLAGNALTDLLLGTHSYNPAIVAHPTVPGGGTFPTTTPALGGGSSTPSASGGYGGPDFATLVGYNNNSTDDNLKEKMAAYLAYYQAHPNENPGIASLDQINGLSGDNVKGDENAARALYNNYQSYLATHPNAATPALGSAAPAATSALAPSAPGQPTAGAVPLADRTGDRPLLKDFNGDIGAWRAAVDAWKRGPAAAPGTPGTPAAGGTTPPAGTVTTPAPSAQSAWDAFRNSTNYTWRLGQGENALASNYAAHGAFDSGAEKKALLEYGQNFASNELSNYMNLLASQQAAGLTAAGAVMGVGTNYAGNVAAQNTSAANAAANAALASGNANAGMWGAIGNGLGNVGGALFQYGMGAPTQSVLPANTGYNTFTGAGSGTNNYFQAHPFG